MTSPRPVTVAVIAYNQVNLIEKAVQSAFAQTWPNLEIILSDDASTDGTFERMKALAEAYRGPHRVRVRQNPKNLRRGHPPAICAEAAHDLIVQFHGDDVSVPHRVQRIVETVEATGACLVGSNALQTDVTGKPLGTFMPRAHRWTYPGRLPFLRAPWTGEFLGATLAYDRRLHLPPFPPVDQRRVFGGNDIILPFRAAILGTLAWIGEPLVLYRRHADQGSHQLADWTAGEPALHETASAHKLMGACQKLREIDAVRGTLLDGPSADAMAAVCREALIAETAAWAERRASLMADGFRPVWMPVATYEQYRKRRLGG